MVAHSWREKKRLLGNFRYPKFFLIRSNLTNIQRGFFKCAQPEIKCLNFNIQDGKIGKNAKVFPSPSFPENRFKK